MFKQNLCWLALILVAQLHPSLAAQTQPCSSSWSDLGFGLAGVSGIPSLTGSGQLLYNEPGSLWLHEARPDALAVLFVSLHSTPQPFKGGTLVPLPVLLAMPLVADGTGSIGLGGWSIPSTTPVPTSFYVQYAIQDPTALNGVSLSNALLATTGGYNQAPWIPDSLPDDEYSQYFYYVDDEYDPSPMEITFFAADPNCDPVTYWINLAPPFGGGYLFDSYGNWLTSYPAVLPDNHVYYSNVPDPIDPLSIEFSACDDKGNCVQGYVTVTHSKDGHGCVPRCGGGYN